jgi:hypothetical protein
MSITIKKAKLKGRRLTLDYFSPVEGGSDTISVKCANQVHPDLLAAMDKLIPHFILLCELPEASILQGLLWNDMPMDDVDMGKFPKVQVTGYSIGGDDENEGLTIIGSRLLEKGKSLNVNSPFTKYDREEYQYADELNLAIQEIENEIREFLNGKISNKQLDMFEDAAANGDDPFGETQTGNTVTIKPKGKRNKKVSELSEAV